MLSSIAGPKASPPNGPITTNPIEAIALGVAQGRSPEECILSIHTGPMVLGFATTANALAALRDELNKILVPIGSEPLPKN